jgi:hypothetical protein
MDESTEHLEARLQIIDRSISKLNQIRLKIVYEIVKRQDTRVQSKIQAGYKHERGGELNGKV